MSRMLIRDHVRKARAGEIDIVEHTHKVLEQCHKTNEKYHFFNTISDELAKKQAELLMDSKRGPGKKGVLCGLPVSIKDSIVVRDVESTAGSRILKGYKPKFNATAVQKLVDEGAVVLGKNSQDEFGFGSFSVNVGIGFKVPKNPLDVERACGGSSGGGAGLTKLSDFAHISLGESTGGSIATPASFCGVVGICPTYGRVSRSGIMDFGSSLDKIGPFGKDVYEAALGLEVISGHDPKDSTSSDHPVERYTDSVGKDIKGMKIGLIRECMGEGVQEPVEKSVWDAVKRLESYGAKYEEISLPIAGNYSLPTYYVLAMSEASTNLAKYCGMRYGMQEKVSGNFNAYFSRIREANLGKEAKRRIIVGTYARMSGYRDACYLKAAKVRTKIIEDYEKAFSRFDVLMSPTSPTVAPRFDEIEKLSPLQHYKFDQMTVGPNLAGLPHISVPFGQDSKSRMPVGVMFVGRQFGESRIVQAGSALEDGYGKQSD